MAKERKEIINAEDRDFKLRRGEPGQEKPLGCVEPAKGPIESEPLPIGEKKHQQMKEREGSTLLAKVGRPAPDFEANAFVNGGFTNIRLSRL